MELTDFDAAFKRLPEGHSEGIHEGRRFGLIVRRSDDGRRNSLFARELGGTDIVSFNLYRFTSAKHRSSRARCLRKRSWISCLASNRTEGVAVAALFAMSAPALRMSLNGYRNYSAWLLDFVWR